MYLTTFKTYFNNTKHCWTSSKRVISQRILLKLNRGNKDSMRTIMVLQLRRLAIRPSCNFKEEKWVDNLPLVNDVVMQPSMEREMEKPQLANGVVLVEFRVLYIYIIVYINFLKWLFWLPVRLVTTDDGIQGMKVLRVELVVWGLGIVVSLSVV